MLFFIIILIFFQCIVWVYHYVNTDMSNWNLHFSLVFFLLNSYYFKSLLLNAKLSNVVSKYFFGSNECFKVNNINIRYLKKCI